MTKEEKLKQASFRIIRDLNGEYRVEVLDKTIGHWYIVASKMGNGRKGFDTAVKWSERFIADE